MPGEVRWRFELGTRLMAAHEAADEAFRLAFPGRGQGPVVMRAGDESRYIDGFCQVCGESLGRGEWYQCPGPSGWTVRAHPWCFDWVPGTPPLCRRCCGGGTVRTKADNYQEDHPCPACGGTGKEGKP